MIAIMMVASQNPAGYRVGRTMAMATMVIADTGELN